MLIWQSVCPFLLSAYWAQLHCIGGIDLGTAGLVVTDDVDVDDDDGLTLMKLMMMLMTATTTYPPATIMGVSPRCPMLCRMSDRRARVHPLLKTMKKATSFTDREMFFKTDVREFCYTLHNLDKS